MPRIAIATALLVGWIVLGSARPAQAQRGYHIPRPTFSPYLNYFRADPGPVDPYYSYIVPQRQLQRTLAGQSAQIQRQQRSIGSLQSQFNQFQQSGPVAPTGLGATFGNYYSYYSGLRMGGTGGTAGRTYTRPTTSGLGGY